MEKIFVIERTQFDFEFVKHIRDLRKSKGLSAEKLSEAMGLVKSFVGNVESFSERHKYSTRHIALLAKAFGYNDISDLMRFATPQHDNAKITVKQIRNESGTRILDWEAMKIEPIEVKKREVKHSK